MFQRKGECVIQNYWHNTVVFSTSVITFSNQVGDTENVAIIWLEMFN